MRVIDAALMARLSGDATLAALVTGGVHHAQAPQDAVPPYLLFREVSLQDGYTLRQRVWREGLYDIQAVTSGLSVTVIQQAIERVDVLLRDHALAVSGGSTLYLRRVQTTEFSEAIEGVVYQYAVATYRIWVA